MKDNFICKTHMAIPEYTGECPWCKVETLEGELKSIRDSFQMAVVVKDYYWGDGQVPFKGEFSDISPSTARDMARWVERWNKLFNDKDELDKTWNQ